MSALDLAGLYDRLDAKRETLGISWREVAKQTGLSPSTISRMTNGHKPSVDAFLKILEWVGDDPIMAALAMAQKRRPTETNPDLREVLDRLVRITENAMDVGSPWGDDGACVFCCIAGDGSEHEEWCGWTVAKSFAPSDLTAVRRHARSLGYQRHPS